MRPYIFILLLLYCSIDSYGTDYYSTTGGDIYNGAKWSTDSDAAANSGSVKTSFLSTDNLIIRAGDFVYLPSSDVTVNTIRVATGAFLGDFQADNIDLVVKNLIVQGSLSLTAPRTGCTITLENFIVLTSGSVTLGHDNTQITHNGLLYASSSSTRVVSTPLTNFSGNGSFDGYADFSTPDAMGTLYLATSSTEGTLEDIPSELASETATFTLVKDYVLKISSPIGSGITFSAGSDGSDGTENGSVEFLEGASGTFNSNGNPFNNMVMNTSSGITLNADVTLSGQLTLTNGIIHTGSNTLTVETIGSTFASTSDRNTTLPGGSNSTHVDGILAYNAPASTNYVFLPVGDESRLRPVGVRNTTGTHGFTVTAQYIQAAHADAADVNGSWDQSTVEHWDISVTGDAISNSNNFDVILTYDSYSNVNTGSLETLHLTHYVSGTWESEITANQPGVHNVKTGTAIDNVTGFLETSVTQFSPFGMGGGAGQDLPIELTYFNAERDNQNMIFNWETAIEIDNDYFEIEGSTDKRISEVVAIIDGAGNSPTPLKYAYNASELEWNQYRYFRLKQTDFDGKYSYSEWIEVNNSIDVNFDYILYPNPSHDVLNIETILPNNEVIESMQIVDLQGKMILNQKWDNQKEINTSQLNNGVYLMMITTSSGERKIQRFTVQ